MENLFDDVIDTNTLDSLDKETLESLIAILEKAGY